MRFHPAGYILLVVAATALLGATPLLGQETDRAAQSAEAANLAKKLQNPLANLVTLPLQVNFNDGVGEFDRRVTNFNVQPVIPFPGEKWNVISRTIIPFISVPEGERLSVTGVGDMSLSLFVSPARPGSVIWGLGPAFILPTASNPELLGQGKVSAGPTAVIFWGPGHWTMGFVANQVWSIFGEDDRESVSQFFAQWFLNYNLGSGWAIGTAPIITCNWKAPSGERCVFPLGGQLSKVMRFGNQPVNLLAGYYYNVERPEGTADYQIRIQLNILFPTTPRN